MLQTRHEWIAKLAAASDAIAAMRVDAAVKDAPLEKDALVLSNCDAHCRLVTRAIESLVTSGASTQDGARDLLSNLIGRATYGSFAELAAYDWLMRGRIRIQTQVAMTPNDVLAANGSTLDGKFVHDDIHFDVKAFGFHGRMAELLKEKLEASFPSEQVLIEESWDLSIETFSDLLKSASDIANKLAKDRIFREGRMRIRRAPKAPVTISMRGGEPYHLAKENALYPFRYAKQFTRNTPFILIFVVHPWFNALAIHNDFAGEDTKFTRSLARRAFMQFSNDPSTIAQIRHPRGCQTFQHDLPVIIEVVTFEPVEYMEGDVGLPIAKVNIPSKRFVGYLHLRTLHPLIPKGTTIHFKRTGNETFQLFSKSTINNSKGIDLGDHVSARVISYDPSKDDDYDMHITILDGDYAGRNGWLLSLGAEGDDGTPIDMFSGAVISDESKN